MNEPYVEIVFPRSGYFLKEIIGPKVYSGLNEEDKRAILFLHDNEGVSKKEYAGHFKFDDKKAQRHLSKFRNLNLALTAGNGPSLRYRFKSFSESGH
jgi:hypothetical protein